MSSSSSKTILDFFKQPAAKRLKTTRSSPAKLTKLAAVPNAPLSSSSVNENNKSQEDSPCNRSANTLTSEEKSKIQLNKAVARAKRNLKLCSDKISKRDPSGEGLDSVKLEELLVEKSWVKVLTGELEKPYGKKLCKFVESEIKESGVPIYPPQHLIFNALNTTPFDAVKVVIIGQDPYHGPGQAMGLSFSVPNGIKVPSSLVNIYKELQQDLGCSIPSHGNLEKWALQGVLLLNAVLTVRKHQANSHAKKGWEQFTDAVIKTISQDKTGVVFLLWGNYAQAKASLIDQTKHYILKSAHPSGLSANRGFFGCRHFSQANQILEKAGMSPINWQL